MGYLLCMGDSGRLDDERGWHHLSAGFYGAGGTGSASYSGEDVVLIVKISSWEELQKSQP